MMNPFRLSAIRPLCFALLGACITFSAAQAAEPTYALRTKFPYATRLVADPIRPRIYGTLTASNSVLVIDTNSLTSQTIPIGSAPVGLALSSDNARLYVANSGSTSGAIGILDLDTLQTLPPIAAPAEPWDIAVGVDGICYLSPIDHGSLMRIEVSSGTSMTFGRHVLDKALLRLNHVQQILYVADASMLWPYDLATLPPIPGEWVSLGDRPHNLELSSDGTILAAPTGGGNDYPGPYTTRIIPTSNLGSALGHLGVGAYPNAIVFSNDGRLAYQGSSGDATALGGAGVIIQIFDLQTFARKTIVHSQLRPFVSKITDLAIDNANRFLFVGIHDSAYLAPNSGLYVYDLGPASQNSYPLNLSTRGKVGDGDDPLIAGFIISGSASKRIAVRALGPSLKENDFIINALDDPTLELLDADGYLRRASDNWSSDPANGLETYGLGLKDFREAGLVAMLQGGSYTAIVRKKPNARPGIAIVELYDLDGQPATPRMANVSTRGRVGTGNEVMIAGLIAGGNDGRGTTIAVRALGPSLLDSGVAGALADPNLEFRDGNGGLIAQNDDWRTDQAQQVIESGLAPRSDRESAAIIELLPGNYTAVVQGSGASTGVALVEVYNLDTY